MLSILKSLNLFLAFLLELAMLAAFAYWGFHTGQTTILKIGLGIGIPLLAAVIWGLVMAPNSSRRLQGTAYLALKLVLFGLAVVALILTGNDTLGIVFGVVVVTNTILLYIQN
ncbi:MAG: YrdB family protein [Omnitrophica WOR_2 bacterium]